MKIKELKARIWREKDDTDVVIMLNKSDVEKINKIAETEPAVLILNADISPELVNNMLAIFIQ